mmetsp:Transcript_57219/g.86408  ORF Transcript_57219/g.86408 Transcript_57219/m.86408 type:complete len:596 (+) Transcript_57219:115-1902(+)
MPILTKLSESLDWPTEDLEIATIECAGRAFLEYQTLATATEEELEALLDEDDDDNGEDDADGEEEPAEDTAPAVDLFSLSEQELEEINYYKVLHLPFRPHLNADDIKNAYRKACLKYHPDKSGRGEDDGVFLKVKAAFETLTTQKQAYDSTEMPFDDSLPDADVTPEEFFAEFAPAFERNLYYDARLLPNPKKKNGKKKKTFGSKPPSLGNESLSIQKVHEFYDYWTHFTTWRDFGLQAARELEAEDQIENAESRYEKRWYQKEVDRHAKKLKQQEQARITTLVERAMALDPRLIQERKRLIEEKEQRQRQREQDALDKKRQAEEAKLAEERRLVEEKERKAQEKVQREKEKKMLRKTKQAFKKIVADTLSSLQKREHELEDEVDFICSQLDREQLLKLNSNLESKTAPEEIFQLVKRRANNLHEKKDDDDMKEAEEAEKLKAEREATQTGPQKIPFTKEELSSLAKGIKKFPPGGANRWDQIASYINNVCRPETPRTKEECIATFNQINKGVKPAGPGSTNGTTAKPTANGNAAPESDGWTEEQDKQLQEGLAKFPASMDKNERWMNIAKCVPGKSKKDCVQRFKAIRDAIKNK